MQLRADEIESVLANWPVAHLATLADDGRAELVPIVFVWRAGRIWSPIDGKPKRGVELARVRNVRREPRVEVLLDRYDPDWARLFWLRVRGRAELAGRADPHFAEVERALREKYPQYAQVPLFAGEPTLLRIAPERLTSWCGSRLAAADLLA